MERLDWAASPPTVVVAEDGAPPFANGFDAERILFYFNECLFDTWF